MSEFDSAPIGPTEPPDKPRTLRGQQSSSDSQPDLSSIPPPHMQEEELTNPLGQDVAHLNDEEVAPSNNEELPSLPTPENFKSNPQSRGGIRSLNFRAATAAIEDGSSTKWILFHLDKSIRSQTWTLNDKEIAEFVYNTLKLKKGQCRSYDDSYDKAIALELINEVDLDKLPINQGLELTQDPAVSGLPTDWGWWLRLSFSS